MSQHGHVPADVYRRITGFEKLQDFFGFWPSFHDAEIMSIELERSDAEEFIGPMLRMRVHAFHWGTNPVSNTTVMEHHCVVEFCFKKVTNLILTNFHYQNAIYGLEICTMGEEPPLLSVSYKQCFGGGCSFQCEKMQVVSVVPGIPEDNTFIHQG